MSDSSAAKPPEWYRWQRSSAKYDLFSSGVSPISIAELLEISENKQVSQQQLALDKVRLDDDESPLGHAQLRKNLASLYSARSAGVTHENILITNAAASANYTTLSAILSQGDHVIHQHPIDNVLSDTLKSLGVEVTAWEAKPAKKWQADVQDLKDAIKETTKLVVIQSPCDPTGTVVSKSQLEDMIEVAQEKGLIILADESYRPLFHSLSPSDEDFPPSAINMGYRKVIVTGTVNHAYSLPGVKVGWIACKNADILEACQRTQSRIASSPSRLDEIVAAEALSDRCIHALLSRNIRLCQTNLELLQGFVDEHSWAVSWVKPQAGTTAMLKFHKMGKPVDDVAFCAALLKNAGVFLCPASATYGDSQSYRGYVRVAFGAPTSHVKAALAAWTSVMEDYESVPTASQR
ncbi:hypothetical protein PV08_04698 [Exophiala spinifera]|uniref:Aminotransferase class I/classII large domain-containing protein n=1 Tax=Exophiala spinifera TaxID=91928 RepID=A0A0D2C1H1_9EURO|nr:uncharacterized protein PV08_04698 [Exophiala spinifera]KIW17504.1 hypothetical protein PV08_04698 [Exophiala spinifera]